MIDPLRQRADAATQVVPSTGMASTPGRINPLPGLRLDQISAALAAAPQLSPAQSKQIVALLRATLESFAAPVRGGQPGGSLGALQAAVVSLGHLQEDLSARLTSHQDQTRLVAPILQALMHSVNGDQSAGPASRAAPSFMRGAAPAVDTGPTIAGPRTTATPMPGSATTAPGPLSVTSLAQSLAEAIARLQEILSGGIRPAALPAQRTAPGAGLAVPLAHGSTAQPPAPLGPPFAGPEPPDAFRWLLDAALKLTTTGPIRPEPTQGETIRLTSLARALLGAFTTPTSANALPRPGAVVRGTPESSARPWGADVVRGSPDPDEAAALQSDLWVALDRYPRIAPLLTPILRELGLQAGNAQLAPPAVSAEVFAAAIARVQILAVIVLAEAEGVAAPGWYHQILAACQAAGMPPFGDPVDSADSAELADNIETYRWLLIAAQLYTSRGAPRPPLQRCNRCGRILQRSRGGILICPKCT
jgi:hypothetical protein